MIREKRILIFIKVLEVYYESEKKVKNLLEQSNHLSCRVYSYFPMDLGNEYALLRKKETSRLSLENKTEETLLASFKKNYRNEVRKTFNNSCYRIEMKEGFSDEGYRMYMDFEKKSKRSFLSKKNMNGLWFLSYYNDQLMSGIYVTDVKPVLKIVAIFSSRKEIDKENKQIIGYLSKRLIYEIGCFGICNGHEFVDLAYINRNDPKKAGITAYKLGFGGDIVNEYLYERNTSFIKYLKISKKKIGI